MRIFLTKSLINHIKIIFTIVWSLSHVLGQESWVCSDEEFKEAYIAPYVDILLKENEDIDDEKIPSYDDNLVIYIKGETITELYADGENGAILLDKEIYDRLDPEIKAKLLKRKYDWDHIEDIKFQIKGRNAYGYANHKTIRDHYWWTRNLLTANPFTFNNSYILRPEPGLYSIMFKQGDEEIGYPATLSRNSRVFISTEPTQVFLNLPWEPRNISFGDVHPLESTIGGGVSFDMDKLGGMVSYNSIGNLNHDNAFDPDHIIYNNWAGILYWTRSFKFRTSTPGETSKDFKRRLPWIPKGTQRIRFGVSHAKLIYGKIDSTDNFAIREKSDFGTSFSPFFNWTYVSEQILPEGSYNYYHKLTAYFHANIGEGSRFNMGFLRSVNASFAVGLNIGWAESITFLEGQDTQYKWEPGIVISPNFTLRF